MNDEEGKKSKEMVVDKPEDLRLRTKRFALDIIRLSTSLTKRRELDVIGSQVLRSGTSVGAHYREAFRSRSGAEFISKLEGGLQELDETCYWLELLEESGFAPASPTAPLRKEADELTRIFVASVRTAKRNL